MKHARPTTTRSGLVISEWQYDAHPQVVQERLSMELCLLRVASTSTDSHKNASHPRIRSTSKVRYANG